MGREDHQLQSSGVKHYTLALLVHWLAWSWSIVVEWLSLVTQHPYQQACFDHWSLSGAPAGSTSHESKGVNACDAERLLRRGVKWVTVLWCSCVAGGPGMQRQVWRLDHLQSVLRGHAVEQECRCANTQQSAPSHVNLSCLHFHVYI